MFLASVTGEGPLRVLELGSGSGVFAKLFLDNLRKRAPEVYARTLYIASDGWTSVLEARSAEGVLAAHGERIESRVIDAGGELGGPYDAVLGTYILDSLPFDLLAVCDEQTWRKEARTVVENLDDSRVDELIKVLAAGDPKKLADWAWVVRHLGLQTRHAAVGRGALPFGSSLPRSTGGATFPFIHCHGALACLQACRAALRPGGIAIFSDYGHLSLMPPDEFLEFQSYGNSIAVGVNFPQLSAAAEEWDSAELYAPTEEDGNLYTRVLHLSDQADERMQALVDQLYGAETYRRRQAPLDRARNCLKSRYFEAARSNYRIALAEQPDNWALMEEVASGLLTMLKDHSAAAALAAAGLKRNPLAPGLWLVRGEALRALGKRDEARAALAHLTALVPTHAPGWRALANLEADEANYPAALHAVAEGLANDQSGDEQEDLLAVQGQVLAAMTQEQYARLMATANELRATDLQPQ